MVIAANPSKQAIDPWAFRELGLASFEDARLTARVLRLATDWVAHPALRCPASTPMIGPD